jgi:SET domain-containing protein
MPTLKKEIIKSLKNNYCRLKPSKINGIGVAAIKDIPKGKKLFVGSQVRRWAKFRLSELKNFDQETREMIKGFFAADDDGGYWVCQGGLNSIDISFYLNHSNKPNLKAIINKKTDFVSDFVTVRKIKKGEELTVSYETLDSYFEPESL